MSAMAATPHSSDHADGQYTDSYGGETGYTGTRAARHGRWLPNAALLLMGALAGGLGVYACGKAHDRGAETMAAVNGVPITRQSFTHRLETASGNAVLQQMIGEETQLQFAQRHFVLPSDAQVQAKYDEASRQPGFARSLALSHQTPEDVKRARRVSLIQQEALTKGVVVSDSEVEDFYKANADKNNPAARYYRPETVVIAAILSDKEADIDRAQHELAAGRSFGQVAQVYSRDASKANGGLLAPIQRGRVNAQQFPGMEERLFHLKAGEQIDKTRVAGAWWIIRCLSKTPEQTVPFDQVRAECRTGAMLTKGLPANASSLKSDFAAFQQSADIKIVSPEYKELLSSK